MASKQKNDTDSSAAVSNKYDHPVISDLHSHLAGSSPGGDKPTSSASFTSSLDKRRTVVPLPVAAIRALLNVIRRSQAETMMGLQAELRKAEDVMLEFAKQGGPITSDDRPTEYLLAGRSHIALASGCELFMKYVTRAFLELPDFSACKAAVLLRGEHFADLSLAARDRIASVGESFVRENSVVLTHGRSRVVESLLVRAAKVGRKRFSVIVLEGRPDAGGAKAARAYAEAGIPTTVVLDAAMAYVMERVDLVIVGAEGVVENGGVVNKVGTCALGITAKELGVPFYVAAESYKFARLYPLNNADLPDMGGCYQWGLNFVDTMGFKVKGSNQQKNAEETVEDNPLAPFIVDLPKTVAVQNPPCDFTPAKYITLLFTDLGVLTPSAVSDELIRLYQ